MCLDAECGYSIGSFLYVFERLASCCAMAAVVSCLIATLIIMLGMGIGVGYNYCFVDAKVAAMSARNGGEEEEDDRHMEERESSPADIITGSKSGDTIIRSKNKTFAASDESLKRIPGGHSFRNTGHNAKRYAMPLRTHLDYTIFKHISGSTDTVESATLSTASIEVKPTMVVPLRNFDLISFIKKLRQSNKNVTLELIL